MLYQVWSLIRTIDDCCDPTSPIDIVYTLQQTDRLILSVTENLEGGEENEIIQHLLKLREALSHQQTNQDLTHEAEAARAGVINLVNNFFYDKMSAVPQIKDYMDAVTDH
jgi:hypothetical protein